ncbi:hypothetical protein TWF694_010543 [Orbilia ellipsospora]|uniref:Ankyrin repeat protein n=1 Tax=Orbilia ellipsospora TaxID=2528407 RepID=A0AAV9XBC4_9PEZI
MPKIHDLITSEKLDESRLNASLSEGADPNEFDSNGFTPLCLACYQERPKFVNILLKRTDCNFPSSKNRTALWYAADSGGDVGSTGIIEALLKSQANPNIPSHDREASTPLMRAVLKLNKEKVATLLRAKAQVDLSGPNDQDSGAIALVNRRIREEKKYGTVIPEYDEILRMLEYGPPPPPSKLFQFASNFFASLFRYMVYTVNQISSGFKTVFGISGEDIIKNEGNSTGELTDEQAMLEDPIVENTKFDGEHLDEVKKLMGPDPQQNLRALSVYMEQCGVQQLFKDNPDYVKTIAEKAALLSQDPSTDLGKGENMEKMVKLALYQTILLCDDSGSMQISDGRLQAQQEIIRRVVSIATKIAPDDKPVEVRFINHPGGFSFTHASIKTIDSMLSNVTPDRSTPLGEMLQKKVLRPFFYSPVKAGSLKHPLLVSIITDGAPDSLPDFLDYIKGCYSYIRSETDFNSQVVQFLVSKVGQDEEATNFLNVVQETGLAYCTGGQLDKEMEQYRENERELEVWLLNILTAPIMRFGKQSNK